MMREEGNVQAQGGQHEQEEGEESLQGLVDDSYQDHFSLDDDGDDDSTYYSQRRGRQQQQEWSRIPTSDDFFDRSLRRSHEQEEHMLISPANKLRLLVVGVVFVCVTALFVPASRNRNNKQDAAAPAARKFKGTPQYTCPPKPLPADNTTEHGGGGSATRTKEIAQNLTAYIDSFRYEELVEPYYVDGVQRQTYNERKESMRPWKEARFLPDLKTGDSFYETGCGMGLDLLLTLEILQDSGKYVGDLHVYGDTPEAEQAAVANPLLDTVLVSTSVGKRGVICAADSSSEVFVPANAFDLVYTSYMAPLHDPLEFGLDDEEDCEGRMKDLCRTADTDWKAAKLKQVAQERQNDWYAARVTEMIRIAKPGVPVIVEQVNLPYCEVELDTGGVPQSFWNASVGKYEWDIDPDSIEFEMDPISKKRYHVFMRKRKQHH